jgi:hypothetical protein
MKYGLLSLLLAGSLQAQTTWYVDVNAVPPGLGTQANPYTSIQYAHDQPSTLDWDTLRVRPGTYRENLVLSKRITVSSTQGPDSTFLLPAGPGPILRLQTIQDQLDVLNVVGFTITGMIGPSNTSAVRSFEGTLVRCVIRGNRTGGWAVETLYDSNLVDCTVVDNDGGIEATTLNDAVWLRNCIVWGNGTNLAMNPEPFFHLILYCAGGPYSWGTGNVNGDPGMWSLVYHDYRPRPGSPCVDAGDPALLDLDGSRSDIGYYTYDPNYAPVASYCTGKLNSDGCVPQIAGSGLPSTTGTSPFLVTASLVLPGRTSLLLYGYAEGSLPFQGGTLCLSGSSRRVGAQLSAGSGSCGGSCAYDFNARIQSGADPALVPGAFVFAQWYQRDPLDPAGYHSGLTNALRFGIVP